MKLILPCLSAALLAAALGCSGSSSAPAALSVPVITDFQPRQTTSGSTVTVTGTGLQGAIYVSIGGTKVTTWKVASDTSMTLTVPDAVRNEYIEVVNDKGTGGSTSPLTITPTVTAVSATSVAKGMVVTLTGTGFDGVTKATKVTFGGGAGSPFQIQSATTLVVNVADDSVSGPVTVVASGLTATGPNVTIQP